MRGAVAPGLFAPPGGLLDHMFACDRGRGRGEIGPEVSEPFSARGWENQPAGATRAWSNLVTGRTAAGRRVAARDATSARVSRSTYRVSALVKEVKERSGTGLTFGTVASSADLSSSPRASSRDGDDDGGGFLGDGVGLDRAGASSSAASSSTPSGNRPSGRSPRSSSSPSRGAPAAEEVMPAGGQSSGNKLTVSPFFFPFRSGGWGGCRAATRVSDPRPGATPRRVDA